MGKSVKLVAEVLETIAGSDIDDTATLLIPKDFDYKKLKSISAEALEKLRKIKPETISQASRISGVSPNDISVLLVYMGR